MADLLGYACIAHQKGFLPWVFGFTGFREADSWSGDGVELILSALANTF